MKIAIVSDTHFEFGTQASIKLDREVDVLILAGDIDKATNVMHRVLEIADGKAKHIVYVAGNHEYYGNRIDKAQSSMYSEDYIHFLNDTAVVIDGWTFAGGTLWTDYNLDGNQTLAMMMAEGQINDHRRIKINANGVYRRFLARDQLRLHNDTKEFLWDQIGQAFDENRLNKLVVITHHAPTHASVNDRYIGDPLNACYANNWGHRISYTGPKYWFHGHVHDPVDYMCGDTRVIANPYGYPGERKDAAIRYLELVS